MAGRSNYSTASITVALATVSLLAAAAWWQTKRQASTSSKKKNISNDNEYPPAGISPGVQHTFEECAERIRHITHLSDGDKLFLYALYKQATVGDAPESFSASAQSSSWNVVAAQAKYYAWRKLHGMPRTGAIFQYIATAQIHIDEHMMEEKTACIDNRTGVMELSSGTGSSDIEDEQDEPRRPSTIAAAAGGGGGGGSSSSSSNSGMLGVAVSRPIMASDDEDDETTQDDHTIEGLFLRAAAGNNVELIHRLVQDHFPDSLDINHKDHVGQTALHLAADHGAINVLEYLLTEHGQDIDVNAADDDGISVLQAAVIAGQVEACRLLLKHGANPDMPDDDGDTPRHCAADDGSEELKELFASTPVHQQQTEGNGHF